MASAFVDQSAEIPLFGVNGEKRHKVKTYAILREDNEQGLDAVSTTNTEFTSANSKSAWDYVFPSQEKLINNVGARLAKRKQLFFRRKLLADISLAAAAFGLLLAIINCELYVQGLNGSPARTVLKCGVSVSTFALLLLVLYYHVIDIRVYMIDNSQDDWRYAVTNQRILKLVAETLVCAAHTFPCEIYVNVFVLNAEKNMVSEQMPLDIMMTLVMFARFYLVLRCATLHSRLFEGAASQILGPLNRITLNFAFILKASLQDSPVMGLTSFIVSILVVTSWALRVCESTHSEEQRSMLNSLWLVAITFLTVGYGDIVPQTLCGRVIAVVTGVCGSAMTALIVAVIAKKLELSPAQKSLHSFVKWSRYEREIKELAATIMKEGWRAYRARRRHQKLKAFQHQRNVIRAVHLMRKYKDLLASSKNDASAADLHKNVTRSADLLQTTGSKVTTLASRLTDVENSLTRLHQKLDLLVNRT